MINIEKYIVKVCSETGEGSGFLLEGGYIVTANHNIRDGKTNFFILNELTNKFDQKLEIDNPGFVPIRKAKEEGDFAVFRLKYGEKLRHRTLSLLPEHKSTGKEFMCYGFPKDEAPTGRAYNNGKIDAIEQPHVYSYPRMNLLNTNEGVIKPGFSGSPIIDPVQGAVVGIILMEKDGVDVIGVGGAWIKQHLLELPKLNRSVNRFFDKKIPNLDYHLTTCNREEQIDQLKKYFKAQFFQRAHQHIFLLGSLDDRPDSLTFRFLQELQNQRNPPQIEYALENEDNLFQSIKNFRQLPASERDLTDLFIENLHPYNQQRDYVVFFLKIPQTIWKSKDELDVLNALLDGTFFEKKDIKHRLMLFYWLEPKDSESGIPFSKWFGLKSSCKSTNLIHKICQNHLRQVCKIDSWNDITVNHIKHWLYQFCNDFTKAEDFYNNWRKGKINLNMASAESGIRGLIIQHNPDYQHLRS